MAGLANGDLAGVALPGGNLLVLRRDGPSRLGAVWSIGEGQFVAGAIAFMNDWANAGDATLIAASTAMRASFDVLIMDSLPYAADNGMTPVSLLARRWGWAGGSYTNPQIN